jgi:hypothetical protein
MKKFYLLVLVLLTTNTFSQINSPNGDNLFYYNGLADVIFKYPERGSGGRAFVHADYNVLAINFQSDFTGGTRIGNDVYFKDGGNSFINSGNFGIGTTNPDEKLTVNGKIHAQEVRIDVSAPMTVPDYVFAKEYKLKSLQEVESFIKQNSHLPEIPSAKELEKDGIQLAEMNLNLLKKIEELTLYAIEQQKNTDKLTKIIEEQNKRLEVLEKKN